MSRKYTLDDLRKETEGMFISKSRSFSREIIRIFGEQEALNWFYHTEVPEFDNRTPHAYMARHGKSGRERVASALYFMLSGQPS